MIEVLSAIADKVSEAIGLIPSDSDRGAEVCMGADGTPTSEIDKIAENTVLMYLQEHDVKLNVLSEEIGFVDNGAEETLVLDPIDGTTNACMGVPMYTVSMAVGKGTMNGMRVAYLRNLSTGDVYTAEKGKGAYMNGCRISVKDSSDPERLLMMIYMGSGACPEAYALAKRVKSSRAYGCASLEMALVATGKADGFMMDSEVYSKSIRVVDIAASALILREAGGEIFALDGSILDMPLDLEHRANFVAVGDRKVFDTVMQGSRSHPRGGKVSYGIYVNMSIPGAADVAKEVMRLLKGEDITLDSAIAAEFGVKGVPISKMNVDMIIAVGGDGTILRAAQNSDAMMFGVNAGGIGFLTEADPSELEESIARLRRGDYTVEERAKIQVLKDGEILGDAVNEVVVHTDTVAKIRRFRVYVNDTLATDMRADGMLLSTPTGSTCYAMSLGAPIIDPGVNAWVMVPMAAFRFSARPMVVPMSKKIAIECVMDKGCMLVIDGQKEVHLPGGSVVEMVSSSKHVRFVRFDKDFYTRINEKLVNVQ